MRRPGLLAALQAGGCEAGRFWNGVTPGGEVAATMPRYVPRSEQLAIGHAADRTAAVLRDVQTSAVLGRLRGDLARAQIGEEVGRGR